MGRPPRQKFFEFLPPLRGRGMMEAVMTKVLFRFPNPYNLLPATYHLLPPIKTKPPIAERLLFLPDFDSFFRCFV